MPDAWSPAQTGLEAAGAPPPWSHKQLSMQVSSHFLPPIQSSLQHPPALSGPGAFKSVALEGENKHRRRLEPARWVAPV